MPTHAEPGEVSVVLCRSIALVAQIRREYLQNAAAPMNILAVCSDETAGCNPKKEDIRNATLDPTVDAGSVSASEINGRDKGLIGAPNMWIIALRGQNDQTPGGYGRWLRKTPFSVRTT